MPINFPPITGLTGQTDETSEHILYHTAPAEDGRVSSVIEHVTNTAEGISKVREIHRLRLLCGCVPDQPSQIAQCACGCDRYVCTTCRQPCAVCKLLAYGPHLHLTSTEPRQLVCANHR